MSPTEVIHLELVRSRREDARIAAMIILERASADRGRSTSSTSCASGSSAWSASASLSGCRQPA